MLTSQFRSLASIGGVESEYRFLIFFTRIGAEFIFHVKFCDDVTVEGLMAHTFPFVLAALDCVALGDVA